jgi:HSP20 family protein
MLGRYNDWKEWPGFGLRDLTRQFDEFRRDIDRATFDLDRAAFDFGLGREVWPTVSLSDRANAWELRAELPGLSEKEIELTANADSVTLKAERKLETPARHTVHRRERAAYRLARTFSLPTKIDPEKVEAAFKNGVLTVTLAKAPEAQPRQIAVKAGS